MPKRSIPILIAVFLTLTFSSCTCIYFNTFHNIRKNFNGAEKTRKKDARDKARGSEVKQYNDAIAKASRVLERHPTSSWVDDALFIIGASYYYLGEYNKSARKFKELAANYPESEYASRSRILLAKAKLQLKEEAEAVVLFEEIFAQESDKSMKAEAARSLGEYYFEAKDYANANTYLGALIDSLGEENDKLRALLFVADGYFERYSFDKALENYNLGLKHNPDTLQYYRIMFRMAECDYFLYNLDGGLEKLDDLASNEIYYDSLAPIRLKMAEGYEWEGDFTSAIDTYDRIIVENPGQDAAAVSYYGLGLIYQYDFEDLEKARGYYQKAREEKSNSSVSEDATRRASKLALLERYMQDGETGIEADSTGKIDQHLLDQLTENQFMLGELFYFDLEKPDSALHAFQDVVDKFPESRFAPQALMSMAFIYRTDFSDTSTADSLLREVIDKYPRFDEAEDVISMLGLVGTIVDTGYASIIFMRAEEFLAEYWERDSSMYYMRLIADSVLAADTLPDDTTFQDSLPFAAGQQGGDSLELEDIDLTDGSASSTPETSAAQSPARQREESRNVADSIMQANLRRKADSIRVADSILYADARKAADSIQAAYVQRMADSARTLDSVQIVDSAQIAESLHVADSMANVRRRMVVDSALAADSARVADSARAMELMKMADSLSGGGGQVPSDSIAGLDSLGMPATATRDEPISITDMVQANVARKNADTTTTPDTTLASDTVMSEDSLTVADQSLPQDTSTALDSVGVEDSTVIADVPVPTDLLPSSDMPPSGDVAMHPDLVTAGDSSAAADTIPASDSLSASDTSLVLDSLSVSDTTLAADSLTVTDTLAVADSAEPEVELPKIDYWQVAFDSARGRYDPEMFRLLDSAQYYYNYVIDSFPFSDFSIQARYVLIWMYDRYFAPGDSTSLFELYSAFVDSFPGTEYAQVISDEYGIRSTAAPPKRQTDNQQQNDEEIDSDSSAFASYDIDEENNADSIILSSAESKFITDEDGNILEPAEKYFLREDVQFKYPLEALAYNIEDKLYFHIRIDFSGEVAEVILLNETQSSELNDRIIETVKYTRFDAARIDPELYDHWFYYTYNVRIPADMRQ